MPHSRELRSLHTALHTIEGDGIDVLRAIPGAIGESVGPFIFLDHYGPIPYVAGEAKGASAHPHAGIETLSLLIEGRMRHRDSLGNDSVMAPGDVQWMRAGRGIVHDEQPVAMAAGDRTHGVQLWINTPKGAKHDAPHYAHVAAAHIPLIVDEAQQARVRLIAGSIGTLRGPIETAGAPFVAHASFSGPGRIALELGAVAELGVYVMTGCAFVGTGERRVSAGAIAALAPGETLAIRADRATELLVVGGDPLDAPIVRYGPFVMNAPAELQRALHDFQNGRMGRIAA